MKNGEGRSPARKILRFVFLDAADEHGINPKTGRPEPADSWGTDATRNWINGAIALWIGFSLISDSQFMEEFGFLRNVAIGLTPLLAISCISGTWDIRRKKAAFRAASVAYEQGLRKAFVELESDTDTREDAAAARSLTTDSPHDRPKTS